MQQRQKDFDHVRIGDHVMENVSSFTYLGSNFEADGNSTQDVKTRMAVAKKQFGSFMHIWLSNKIPLKQKLRLYKAGVLSVLTFGHTIWTLNAKLQSTIKGWNSRCMAVITGREIAEECRYPTIDLVAVLRARSLRWAGRELRKAPEESLVHQMLVAIAEHDLQLGIKIESILMDAPTYESVEELLATES